MKYGFIKEVIPWIRGVAGALHVAAGPGLAEECRPLAPIRPGEAVITGAHMLHYVMLTDGRK